MHSYTNISFVSAYPRKVGGHLSPTTLAYGEVPRSPGNSEILLCCHQYQIVSTPKS